jgi:hypothetical protein
VNPLLDDDDDDDDDDGDDNDDDDGDDADDNDDGDDDTDAAETMGIPIKTNAAYKIIETCTDVQHSKCSIPEEFPLKS